MNTQHNISAEYSAKTIEAAKKRLYQWKRRNFREAKKKALKDYAYFKAEDRTPYDIKKRDLKKLGLKQAIIKTYQDRVINKYLNIYSLLNNRDIKPLNSFEHSTEWVKNKTWGANPHSTLYINNNLVMIGTASGCGYDKLSAAINEAMHKSDILNKAFFIYILRCWKNKKTPVFATYTDGLYYSFNGSGVSSIFELLKALGLKQIYYKSYKMADSARYER